MTAPSLPPLPQDNQDKLVGRGRGAGATDTQSIQGTQDMLAGGGRWSLVPRHGARRGEGGPGNLETQGCSGHPGRSDALVALVSYRRNPCLRGVFSLQSACIYGGFALILKISIKIKKRQSSKVPPSLHRHNCGKTAKKKRGRLFFFSLKFSGKIILVLWPFFAKSKSRILLM